MALLSAGGLDKIIINYLDIMNLAVLFEEEFDIEIPDRKASEFVTVGDVADYLREHV